MRGSSESEEGRMGSWLSRIIPARLRPSFTAGDWTLLLLAVPVGIAAGLLTLVQSTVAHELQHLFYGVGINRLSALGSIHHPAKLLFLPLGGLVLGVANRLTRRRTAPVDVVEANALHGGRIPPRDSVRVAIQTIISNGFGASVGLEATYAQAGGGVASIVGQWFKLRRADLRTLVGAGAGAGIAAAFAAPLTGAFYAFEVVIGSYVPAALAPVAAAALTAALLARNFGAEPYLTVVSGTVRVSTLAYLLFAVFGILCSLTGIAIMRIQALAERWVARLPVEATWRPFIGGVLLMPIAFTSPQSLSAGHGALSLDIAMHPLLEFLLMVFMLKAAASIISLSFGFRGGLFFASLFLGSLLGPLFAHGVNAIAGSPVIDDLDATLVGMAALAVAIVGGPMTLSLLVLETTQNFAVTGAVVTATLTASLLTRSIFGYSFSTWRLHLRGAPVRSARDVGWTRLLTAETLMRRDPTMAPNDITIAAFRLLVPLGSTARVLLVDPRGEYRGIVSTPRAYDPELDLSATIDTIARFADAAIRPDDDITTIIERFEKLGTEELAVVEADGRVAGILTENYVQRRYIDESDKALGRLFGE
jgi:CIC family chloride channel protein